MSEYMPIFVALAVFAALLASTVIIWRLMVAPFYKVVRHADSILPVLTELTRSLKDTPSAFMILRDVAQFRTDTGSSLRDVVNRLEVASIQNKIASDELAINIADQRQMIDVNRQHMEQIIGLLGAIGAKQTIYQDVNVESERVIAEDLKEAHVRANEVGDDVPGVAADAAAMAPLKDEPS